MIALALACGPSLLIADGPATALDVTVEAQMLNLIQDIQQTSGLTLLFISHDLEVVGHLCDAVVVTYLGRVMERGPSRRVYDEPRHPYTRALLSATPVPGPKARRNRS